MNARSLESRRRTPTKRALNTFWGMMCANDTRKIFHRSIEEKRYFDESRKERREKKTFRKREREREREDLARKAAIKNFFAASDYWFKQNFLFRFPFFPLLLLFQQAVCCTGKKNEKFGLNSASKRPH
jgi:hypothetical protein